MYIFTLLKKHSFFLAIIFATVFSRFFLLNNVPNATSFDQLHYLLDAKSFYETGRDISGNITLLDIFLFHYPQWAGMQAELPYLLTLLTVGPLGLSLATAALPNSILSIGIVIVMYFLGKELVDKKFGIIAAALSSINPWFIFSGRTAYEVVPATFFYILTMYILLKAKGANLLLAIPAMLLAFYSYIGTKLIFLPFIILCVVYSFFVIHKKRYKTYYLTILGVAIMIVVMFLYQLNAQPEASRMGDIFLPNHPHLAEEVNHIRQSSLSSPLIKFFENKYTLYLKTLITNIFNLTSPIYLFGTGDYFFSIGRHGLFYYLDAFFLLIGIVSFFHSNKKRSFFFIALIVISTFPQVFHNPKGDGNFSPHLALFIPLLLLIIAYGLYTLINSLQNKWYSSIVTISIFFIYSLLFLNFLVIYFYQFPLNDNILIFPNRVFARYVSLASSQNQQIVVHASNPLLLFREYLFYSGIYNKKNIPKINYLIQKRTYELPNITFVQCSSPKTLKDATVIYESLCDVKINKTQRAIAHLKDSGKAFAIYNDVLCDKMPTKNYISDITLTDLFVEKLHTKTFCEKFILLY